MPRGIPKNKTAAPAADGAAPKRRGRPPKNPAAVAAAAEPKKRGPYKKKGDVSGLSLGGGKSPLKGEKLKSAGSDILSIVATPTDLIARLAAVRANIETLSHFPEAAAKEELLHQFFLMSVISDRLNGVAVAAKGEEEVEEQTATPSPAVAHQATTTPTVAAPSVGPPIPPSFAPPPFPPPSIGS